MSTSHVNIVTLLSTTHLSKTRYSFSFDVTHKDNTQDVITKRSNETQQYIEHECLAGGGRSPETELQLHNGKCKLQIVVSGALKHIAQLDKGEDILEYNESQGECRKMMTLAPIFDETVGDVGTIKFKVNNEVKHTVHVYVGDIHPEKSMMSKSCSSASSSSSNIAGSSTNETMEQSFSSDDEVNPGSIGVSVKSSGGEAQKKAGVEAKPLSMIDDAVDGLRLSDQQPSPDKSTVSVRHETAYDRILCDESLTVLAAALTPPQSRLLIIALRVPSSIQAINQTNHHKDVVMENFHSLKHWRAKKTSREDSAMSSSEELYIDLTHALEDIGRTDIVLVLRARVAANKKLQHDDFKLL